MIPTQTQPVILADILAGARTLLNDDNAVNWQDFRLIPKAQMAYRELKLLFSLNSLPIVMEQSSIFTVPKGTTDLSTCSGYPGNLLEPISMKERIIGGTLSDFYDMTRVDFIPDVEQDTRLYWWSWQGGGVENTILLLGALNAVEVQLRFKADILLPVKNSDSAIIPYSEAFLAYRTAGLALVSIGQDGSVYNQMAEQVLDKLLAMGVKGIQNLVAKRIPYHRRWNFGDILRGF